MILHPLAQPVSRTFGAAGFQTISTGSAPAQRNEAAVEKRRQHLRPLRLARQPLHQGRDGQDFRLQPVYQRNRLALRERRPGRTILSSQTRFAALVRQTGDGFFPTPSPCRAAGVHAAARSCGSGTTSSGTSTRKGGYIGRSSRRAKRTATTTTSRRCRPTPGSASTISNKRILNGSAIHPEARAAAGAGDLRGDAGGRAGGRLLLRQRHHGRRRRAIGPPLDRLRRIAGRRGVGRRAPAATAGGGRSARSRCGTRSGRTAVRRRLDGDEKNRPAAHLGPPRPHTAGDRNARLHDRARQHGPVKGLRHLVGGRLCCHNLRHGNDFRSIGDCDPTPSSRSAASCRADLSADSRGRAESCRCDCIFSA